MNDAPSDRSNRFLRACLREPVDCTPIWIMRQAGRYLPEYRAIRQKVPFLTLCKTPDLAAEVTIQPVDRLGVDAAILFSDILIPVEAMGAHLTLDDGGPVIGNPVRTRADVDRLIVPDPEEKLAFVPEAIRRIRRALGGRVPLIGFAGGPFTLASYLVEGGSTRSYATIKAMLFGDPAAAHALLDKIARTVTVYLNAQIRAGAQAVQIFDSWAGVLSPRDFEEFDLPYVARIIEGLERPRGVPVIYFGTETPGLLERMKKSGADVIGLDWRVDIGEARQRLGTDVAVQGNLDPSALFQPPEGIAERAAEILARAGEAPGHVFNLGHGILPGTIPERAASLVEAVHRLGVKPATERAEGQGEAGIQTRNDRGGA